MEVFDTEQTAETQSLEDSDQTELGRCDIHCMTLLFERIASLFAH